MSGGINLPGMLSKKEYLGLPPLKQEKYAEDLIKRILHENQLGITISDITKHTSFTRPTVLKHLERLVSCREGYKIRRGNVFVYYPNGKAAYPEKHTQVRIDDKRAFKATLLENNYGKFVFIEETGDAEISGGGFLVKREEFDLFRELVEKISEEA